VACFTLRPHFPAKRTPEPVDKGASLGRMTVITLPFTFRGLVQDDMHGTSHVLTFVTCYHHTFTLT
jgi:hypothetical protein